MTVDHPLSSPCSDARQSSAARLPANTCDTDSSSVRHKGTYQNVSVSESEKYQDPFGDFEEALRKTSKIRIKKVFLFKLIYIVVS